MRTKIKSPVYNSNNIGEDLRKQLKSIPETFNQQLLEQLLKPLPSDAYEQLTGQTIRKYKNEFENSSSKKVAETEPALKTEEVVIFSAEEEENRRKAALKEKMIKEQIEAIRTELLKEQAVYKAQIKELKETINKVAESANINVNISVQQPGENAGVYHLTFLEKILNFIKAKVDNSKDWSQGIIIRAKGKRPKGLQIFWQKGTSQQQATEQGTFMLQG